MCPTCKVTLQPEGDGVHHDRCGSCNGIWISEASLRDDVLRCLREHGIENALAALLEAPHGAPDHLPCPACGTNSLRGVKIRAVEAAKCGQCAGIFLPSGSTELIALRVLVSAKEWKKGRDMTNNPILADILRNPNQFGNPMA